MRIPCPFCGPRDAQEFVTRGDADPVRPAIGASDDAGLYEYLYERTNPAGVQREHWYHAQGCRNWLVVTRDTVTHAIAGAVLAKDVGA
jgi:sarcosine oxidase subunit delta